MGTKPGTEDTDHVSSPGRFLEILALIGATGPVVYILFATLLGLLWDGYDPIRDTQSELGAVNSPYRHLMNIGGFMTLGASILAFAPVYATSLHSGVAKRLATLFLLIAGAGMVTVGFFPCDAGCVDATQTGRLHSVFSAPAAIGLPAAMMLSAAVFKKDGRFGIVWQLVSFWLGLLAFTSGPLVAAGLAEGALGLVQRLGMWPPLIWMSAVAATLLSRGLRRDLRVVT